MEGAINVRGHLYLNGGKTCKKDKKVMKKNKKNKGRDGEGLVAGGNRQVFHCHWRRSRNPEQPRSQRGGYTFEAFNAQASLRGLPQKDG